MGKNGKNSVAIICPSQIIFNGLKALFEELEFRVLSQYECVEKFTDECKTLPNIVLLDIDCQLKGEIDRGDIKKRDKKKGDIERVYTLLSENGSNLFAISYKNAIDDKENSLFDDLYFDGAITLFDSLEDIEKKVKPFICCGEEVVSGEPNELSQREKEIVASVAQGRTNKEIADLFNISVHTVITHRKNISRKTGITTIPGLTVYAIINNLVNIKEL